MENANKKERILKAARELFKEKGYYAVKAEEIARLAGVGKGTIYQYFESKQDVFREMHAGYRKQYYETITALIGQNDTVEQNLRRIVRYHIDNMEEFSRYGSHILLEMPPAAANSSERWTKPDKQLCAAIQDAQKRGKIYEADMPVLLSWFLGAFLGIACTTDAETLTEADKDQLEEQLLRMILHGLT